MAATVLLTPTKAKQGDRVYVSMGGFTGGAVVTPEIQNYGKFPAVTMNILGSNGFILTVPNLVNGIYTFRASGSDGRIATATLTINSTATSDVAVMVFHTYTLPKYYYEQRTPTVVRTSYALDVMNIGKVAGTVILSIIGSSSTSSATITLQPGQTQSFSGLSRQASSTGLINTYQLRTASGNQTAGNSDFLQFPFYNTEPAAGDSAYYPQQSNAITTIGDPITYPTPPGTEQCPTGYHYDQSGHCINDTDGSCLDCGGGGGGGGGGTGGGDIWDIINGNTFGIPNWLLFGGGAAVAVPVVLAATKKGKGKKGLF